MQADLTLIITYGRSGSSMLMHALSRHPEVLMWREFPYEHRIAQYIFAAAEVGGFPPDFGPIESGGTHYLAARPRDEIILRALERSSLRALRDTPQKAVESVYREIRGSQHSLAGHIVEKGVGLKRPLELAKVWPGARVIFLLRDPRSVFLSIKAFNDRRGYVTFGADQGDLELFNRIVNYASEVHRLRDALPRVTVIRYEDLLAASSSTVQAILTFCNLSLGHAGAVSKALFDHTPQAVQHMTSTPSESVARWRTEATE